MYIVFTVSQFHADAHSISFEDNQLLLQIKSNQIKFLFGLKIHTNVGLSPKHEQQLDKQLIYPTKNGTKSTNYLIKWSTNMIHTFTAVFQ